MSSPPSDGPSGARWRSGGPVSIGAGRARADMMQRLQFAKPIGDRCIHELSDRDAFRLAEVARLIQGAGVPVPLGGPETL